MPRPIFATISIAAMRHNLSLARARAPGRFAWAVVKADGYGHGLDNALVGFGDADGLALVEFDRAARLREQGCTKPLLMLEGAFDRTDVAQAAAQRLTLVVHETRQLDWIERLPQGSAIDVLVKLNSGMNRLGFDAAAFRRAVERARVLPAVASVGLMTHFADADRRDGAKAALRSFDEAARGIDAPRSLANSAAVLSLPAAHGAAIRPGILLYGGTPFADRDARSFGLRAAMTLESRLIALQSLAAGDAVGYGSAFRAERSMRIGIVACGYADGYPRHAPTGTPVVVDGVRTRTLGRVSMDMLAVDLTPLPDAGVGARVELWGEGIAIDEVAGAAGTIGYELMCALAPRVPKHVVDER